MQLALVLASSDDGGGSIFGLLIPFVVIGLIMYLLLIRPQRKKMRDQATLQSSIGVGDEVVTHSGMYGFITGEDDAEGLFWLEIDDDVQIRIAKGAISRRVNSGKSDDDGGDAAVETDES